MRIADQFIQTGLRHVLALTIVVVGLGFFAFAGHARAAGCQPYNNGANAQCMSDPSNTSTPQQMTLSVPAGMQVAVAGGSSDPAGGGATFSIQPSSSSCGGPDGFTVTGTGTSGDHANLGTCPSYTVTITNLFSGQNVRGYGIVYFAFTPAPTPTPTATPTANPGPTITAFANPTSVPAGQKSTITWATTGPVSYVTVCTPTSIFGCNPLYENHYGANGSIQETIGSTSTYTLTAVAEVGGDARTTVTITATAANAGTGVVNGIGCQILAGQTTCDTAQYAYAFNVPSGWDTQIRAHDNVTGTDYIVLDNSWTSGSHVTSATSGWLPLTYDKVTFSSSGTIVHTTTPINVSSRGVTLTLYDDLPFYVGQQSLSQVTIYGIPTPPPGSFTLNQPAASCQTTTPVVALSWSASSGARQYYILKNGVNTGDVTTATTYNYNAANATNYTFGVLADGPGGRTFSTPASLSITTPDCTPKPPVFRQCTLNGKTGPQTVGLNADLLFAWQTDNADSVTLTDVSGILPPTGSKTLKATQSKTYVLKATGAGGTATCSFAVTVSGPGVTLIPSPTMIGPGDAITLTWTSSNATAVSATKGFSTSLLNGTTTLKPVVGPTDTSFVFSITVQGPSGSRTATATVTVTQPGSVSSVLQGSFASNTIQITRTGSLNIVFDPNVQQSPPPGFTQIIPPVTSERP